MSIVVPGIAGLKALAGQHLGEGAWLPVTQGRVNLFADATDDHQWIHVDPERAAAGPYGGTIVHGYLTLSLVIPLWSDLVRIEQIGMAVNYGLNRVRFPAPVRVGSRIRLSARMLAVDDVPGATAGVQATVECTVQAENTPKPALVAEAVYRYYAAV